jgi:hypothetical protein
VLFVRRVLSVIVVFGLVMFVTFMGLIVISHLSSAW